VSTSVTETPRPTEDNERSDELTGESAPAPSRPRRGLDRETLLLLGGLPVLVLVILGGWVLWRATADLDTISERALGWHAVTELAWQHVKLTLVSSAIVVLVAVPLGIAVTRPRLRRLAPAFVGVANAGQAAPAIGLIVLLAIWISFGFWTAVLALTLYGLLPVLRNTVAGLEGVDPTLVEAARGMGMSAAATLLRVELPLAVPVIMAGVRTTLVLVVGTATFGTFVNAGGLGALITTGVTLFRYDVLVSGAVLVAVLALVVEWLGRVLEALARPKGM
jgi:osmoprotectant transport system permease protein